VLAGLPVDAAVAATAFIGTNLDNAVVTMAMVATAPEDRSSRIALGQLIGFALLVGAAAGTAIALFEFSTRIVGLLGLVPLALGVRGLFGLRRAGTRRDLTTRAVGSGFLSSMMITIGAGGDNLAVYIPLFRVAGAASIATTAVVFALGELLLTLFVVRAGRHPRTLGIVNRFGRWATPVLYCAIGVLVLIRAGTISL
jgi:cadmium resistance protein CadD (predicted permease)